MQINNSDFENKDIFSLLMKSMLIQEGEAATFEFNNFSMCEPS